MKPELKKVVSEIVTIFSESSYEENDNRQTYLRIGKINSQLII